MIDPSQTDLLAAVASMYYIDEMTQRAIAADLGVSRVKVYRLLKQAREDGVVEIFINWPLRRDGDLEARLISSFGIQAALVLQASPQARVSSLIQVGQLAARFLEGQLDAGATLAICLGGTTYEVIQAIRPNFRVHVNVVQALGSMPSTMGELDSAALARQLADKLGGEARYLPSPFMAETAEDARVLRTQRDIRRALDTACDADLALLGIGTVDPTRSTLVRAGHVSATALLALGQEGVVGDMAGQLFSQEGQQGPAAINDRVIGLSLDDLRKIPTTIAVALGEQKDAAILGALRSGAVDVLATDDRTARAVLELNVAR